MPTSWSHEQTSTPRDGLVSKVGTCPHSFFFFWNCMYAWWVCNVTVSLTMSVLIGRHSISWFALELIHESELSLVKYHARIPGKGYNYILVPFHGWIKASETCETLNYFELSFAQPSPIHSFINNSTVLARANNRRTLLESCSQHCAPEAECRLLMIAENFVLGSPQHMESQLQALSGCLHAIGSSPVLFVKKRDVIRASCSYFNPLYPSL